MFEPRKEKIEAVKWDGDDRVEFRFVGGGVWSGAKRKDFWGAYDFDWETVLVPGVVLRIWTVSYSIIVGFEAFVQINDETGNDAKTRAQQWVPIWCAANNFQTKAEREAAANAYTKFIEDEGQLIAGAIDAGKTPEEILKGVSDQHSGNTLSWAVRIGVTNAMDRDAAEAFRRHWNLSHGVTRDQDKGGVVNAAVLHIGR